MKTRVYKQIPILVTVAAISVAAPGQAYAYLDPATGSIILQGLIAALAGIAVAGKLYWSRLKSLFGFDRKSEVIDDHQDNDNDKIPEKKKS